MPSIATPHASTLDQHEAHLGHAARILAALLVVAAIGFAGYYVLQLNQHASVSLAERDIQRIEAQIRQYPNDPELRVAVARAYLATGRLDEALSQSEQVLAVEPAHVTAATVAGQAYAARGQPDQAIRRLTTALANGADDPLAQTSLERATAYQLLGKLELDRGQSTAAIGDLQLAVRSDRTNADSLYLLGRALATDGQIDQAIVAYQAALRFVPDFAEVYQDLQAVYEGSGQPERARFARGMLSYANGDYSSAVHDLSEAAVELPQVAEVHLGLGMADERLGRRDAALAEYRIAADLDSSSIAARQGVGRLGDEP